MNLLKNKKLIIILVLSLFIGLIYIVFQRGEKAYLNSIYISNFTEKNITVSSYSINDFLYKSNATIPPTSLQDKLFTREPLHYHRGEEIVKITFTITRNKQSEYTECITNGRAKGTGVIYIVIDNNKTGCVYDVENISNYD